MTAVLRPILRLHHERLLDAEHNARQARRLIGPSVMPDATMIFDATIRIDLAIAALVAARADLNQTLTEGEPA